MITLGAAQFSFANECLPNNYILIHGIGGTPKDFGHMGTAIERQLPCARVYEFSYDTANSNLSTLDFAKSLKAFIAKIPKQKQKEINLIMHSQGGIVGLTYIMNSYDNRNGFEKTDLERLNSYVSASTPFWGSDFALMGKEILFGPGIDENLFSPFGAIQLNDMKYGSLSNQKLSAALSNKSNNDFIKYFKGLKTLNISGMAPYSRNLPSEFSHQFFEGDLVVNTPSMTLNSIQIETKKKYNNNAVDRPMHKSSKLSEQAYAIGTHIDANFDAPGYGIIDVPRRCINLARCDHPGYLSLYQFLVNGIVKSNLEVKDIVKGFEAQIKVQLPKGMKNKNDLRVKVLNNFESGLVMSNYRFKGTNVSSINVSNGQAFFLLKGSIFSKIESNIIRVKIFQPEVSSRIIDIYIEKGLVTHLSTNVNLRK